MAINPLTLPSTQAFSGGVDFTQLGNLGNVYRQGQEQAAQQSALARLGQGQEADAAALIASGVPSLARLGLEMRQQQATQAESIRQFNLQQRIRENQDVRAGSAETRAQSAEQRAQAQEARAAATFEENTPEGRAKKLTEAGLDPRAPEYQGYVATGQNPPDPVKQVAEKRAQTLFEQSQRYATREGRLQAVKDGELDINDPEIRRWVALGGEIPDPAKQRLGLGQPTYTKDPDGTVHAWQLSATGNPVEVKIPPGHTIIDPAQMAQQKAAGAAEGKATAAAKISLPDVVRHTDDLVDNIDKILGHGS